MREYAKLSPKFWQAGTGRKIRAKGAEATVVALYLMSSPHSNMLGLYYQPMLYMAHETGLGIEGASKGLRGCIEAGFCLFDEASEMVWVAEMAAYQIGDSLKRDDKRTKGIQTEYDALPSCPFLPMFFERYGQAFCMTLKRDFDESGEAPCKPLRSQEQEQEQEQEIQPAAQVPALRAEDRPQLALVAEVETSKPKGLPDCPHGEILALWAEVLPTMPQHNPSMWGGTRADHLRARWRETAKAKGWTDKAQGMAYLRKLFGYINRSDFLTGRVPPRDASGRVFQIELEWLVNPTNWAKVHEGKYDNKEVSHA
jgi:hypothetical protein